MKTKLLVISIVAICLAALFHASIWIPTRAPAPIESFTSPNLALGMDSTAVESTEVLMQFPGFPLGITQRIDLNIDNGTRERLSEREWRDLIRDWLLLTVIGDSGVSAYDIGSSLFDLPPLRYGYFKASGLFEYGETRSCYIGDGRIVALVPAEISQAAQDNAISDVVDRHRKDQAGDIASVELFEYRLLNDELTAEVTRRETVDPATYLSSTKGYYEAKVTSLEDLKSLLKQIDDLTYAELTPEGLLLGGRKVQSYEFRGVGLQEVAAIWQSEQDIVRKEREFVESFVKPEKIAFNNRWEGRSYSGYSEKIKLEAERDREWQQVEEKIQERARELRIVDGSGFSLDPSYDFVGLHSSITEFLASVEEFETNTLQGMDRELFILLLKAVDAFTSEDIIHWITIFEKLKTSGDPVDRLLANILNNLILEKKPLLLKAAEALTSENIIPWITIIEKLKTSGDPVEWLFSFWLNTFSNKFRFQSARYDGKLQGTEAGMVLFYTDLLAKIWSMNYLDSAPVNAVQGFVDDTQVKLASIYDKEGRELSKSRLWFGHTDRGFQTGGDDRQLYFQRVSTRVYSKGHNPLDPTNEVQTSAFLAAAIDWWDDHYEEIARYEPEYFRLNEIMKWSLLIGFLTEGGNGERLRFLDAVNVDRSNWFETWANKNEALKFNLWDQIEFYDKGYKNTTTEAMEYLWGEVTSGGVSLAPKTLFRNRSQIPSSLSKLNRRSNIDYATARLGTGEFMTLDGVAVKLQKSGMEAVSIRNTPKLDLRLRAADSDLINAPFERIITKTGQGLKVQATAGGTRLGELDIAKTSNGFKVGWQARDIDAGQTLVLRAGRSSHPESVFASDPQVEQLVKLPDPETYAVKLRNSDKWMIAARGGANDSTVGGGWHSRVADPQKSPDSFQLKWMEKSVVEGEIRQSDWMALESSSDSRLVIADIHSRGPPTQGIVNMQLDIEKQSVAVTVERSTGKVYIPTKDLPASQRLLDIPQNINPEKFHEFRALAKSAKDGTHIPITSLRRIDNALNKNDVGRIANEIVSDPEMAFRSLNQALAINLSTVSKLVSNGETGTALSHLTRLQQVYGSQPEFKLWEGLVELSRGRPQQAAQALGNGTPARIRNQEVFFDEIHARLTDPSIGKRGRDSLENLKHFANWQRKGGKAKAAHGNAVPYVDEGMLKFEFRFVDPLGGRHVLSADEAHFAWESGMPIYRQNSPTFNNLDWNASPMKAFSQIIDMKLGKVVVLPSGDMASLNPTKIIAPAISSQPTAGGTHSTEFVRTSLRSMDSSDGEGDLNDEEEGCIEMNMVKPSRGCLYLLVETSWNG